MGIHGAHLPVRHIVGEADTAVLALHGFTGGTSSLGGLPQALAEAGNSVLAPMLPGHGTRWQELNRTAYEDWLHSALGSYDELRREHARVFVLGLSAGGALALEISLLRDVSGLVLVNPAVELDARGLGLVWLLKHVIPSASAIGDDINLPGVSERAYARTPLRALHSLTRGIGRLRPRLRDVRAPVLLFSSSTDHVVPTSSGDAVWRRIGSRQKRRVILRSSYHVATLDYDAQGIEHSTLSFVESGRP